jgi:hypothetical protein
MDDPSFFEAHPEFMPVTIVIIAASVGVGWWMARRGRPRVFGILRRAGGFDLRVYEEPVVHTVMSDALQKDLLVHAVSPVAHRQTSAGLMEVFDFYSFDRVGHMEGHKEIFEREPTYDMEPIPGTAVIVHLPVRDLPHFECRPRSMTKDFVHGDKGILSMPHVEFRQEFRVDGADARAVGRLFSQSVCQLIVDYPVPIIRQADGLLMLYSHTHRMTRGQIRRAIKLAEQLAPEVVAMVAH